MTDAMQRTILFWDVMRQRSDQYYAQKAKDVPHVLSSTPNWCSTRAPSTSRSTTCWCASSRRKAWRSIRASGPSWWSIRAPAMARASAASRPTAKSGVAMRAGHPCYFVGFTPEPMPGQTIEDIIYAEAMFLEKVIALHPEAEGKPCVIGNCQAGWAVMMLAAIRPELFGPIIVAGSPLSYWAGVQGENPMRYTGGLARRQLDDGADRRPGRRQVRRRLPGRELREPESGQHAVDQELRPLVEGRHRRASASSSSRTGGAATSTSTPRRSSGSSTSCSSATGWPRARSSPQAATASTCATSARRSSASAPRATTSRRRSRRWTGSSTSTAATTTCAPAARPSSMRCTRRVGTWASSSRAAWPRRSTRSSPPTST